MLGGGRGDTQGLQYTGEIAIHQIKCAKQDLRALLSMPTVQNHFIHRLSIPVTAQLTKTGQPVLSVEGVRRSLLTVHRAPQHRERWGRQEQGMA